MSVFFALLSFVTYGAADNLGGLATRKTGKVFAVVILSQVVGLAMVLGGGSGPRPGRGGALLIAGARMLDTAANLFFLLAERRGLLTLVSVITALYPAGTVLLARFVLRERLSRPQLIGLSFAGAGEAMIGVG